MTSSKTLVSTSQNFYQLPSHDATFGAVSPLNVSDAVPVGGNAKNNQRKAGTSMFINQSKLAYQNDV